MPELDPQHLATFLAGGPHGHLFDDLGVLGRTVLDVAIPDRESLALGRRVLTADPRLLVAVHTASSRSPRPSSCSCSTARGRRSVPPAPACWCGWCSPLFDAALDAYVTTTPERPMVELYDATLADARALFA